MKDWGVAQGGAQGSRFNSQYFKVKVIKIEILGWSGISVAKSIDCSSRP